MMENKWYKNSFRRCLVDMHIPDWDPMFFSKFDSKEYIFRMKQADVDTAYIYANSCVGLCNWPTKTGKMHAGLQGRDIIKELTEGLYKEGIRPIIYINIWSKQAYEQHPDWRSVSQDGRGTLEFQWNQPGRYGVCCMNSPYQDYVLEMVKELCGNYRCEGLWVDMILWRIMCYCSHCRKKFLDETGYEIPAVVNWDDPVWIKFLRKREEWNEKFFEKIIETAKAIRPDITVMCNSSYYPSYFMGQSLRFFRLGEFIGGDFDMDRLGHSFNCKLYNSVSKNLPFEFLNSIMDPALNEHSIMKTADHQRALMYSTLANNGRYGFIDAIDPSGTLNPRVYERMNIIFNEEKYYEPYLRSEAEFFQDVGLYTNLESMMNPNMNGTKVINASDSAPHMISTKNAALALIENHIPFGIVTQYDLDNLYRYKILILSDLFSISDEEAEKFEKFVQSGGALYISGRTGLYRTNGKRCDEGRLKNLIGAKFIGETTEEITYIRPSENYNDLLDGYTETHPLTINSKQVLTEKISDAQILGYLTLPLVHPRDITKFASAISDPPGKHTNYPSVLFNEVGKGKVIYSAGMIENMRKADQIALFINLLKKLAGKPFSFNSDAPRCVEITMYKQSSEQRLILNLLNMQKEFPNIPIYNINMKLYVPNQPTSITLLPDEKNLEFFIEDNIIHFAIPELDTYRMILINYN